MTQRQLCWEEIEAGQELPTIELPVSFHKVSMTPYATWDFFPGHNEPDYAQAQGQKSIYLNTGALQGFADRVITQWAGPATFIARRRMSMKASVYVGDTLSAGGRVERTFLEADRACAVLKIWLRTQAAPVVDAETTIVLPRLAQRATAQSRSE